MSAGFYSELTVKVLFSFLPVILFLGLLVYLDSFKLIKKSIIVFCLVWGIISAFLSFHINTLLMGLFIGKSFEILVVLIPPLVEEALKMSFILFLVFRNRTGFLIDAAIYGFAVGTGFAVAENLYYIMNVDDSINILWVVRGFGTAIMHGGTVALLAVIIQGAINKKQNFFLYLLIGYFAAVTIHFLYNWLLYSPALATLCIVICIPMALLLIFQMNEKSLRSWLEIEFDSEVRLLLMIRKGEFANTKSGNYLISIKNNFSRLVVVDILNFIYLYLELSIKAKTNLILKEKGLPVLRIENIESQLQELKTLKKNIGPTGLMAIRPILRMSNKDLWKLTMLT